MQAERTETAAALREQFEAAPYSTFSAEEIAISDRMEDDYNRQHAATRALADEKAGHTVRGMTDGSLARLRVVYTRQIEDIDAGQVTGGKRRRRLVEVKLTDIGREQEFRAALAESWLAREDGTHCYTSFQGRGGLAAVMLGEAVAPSYDLAVLLDWEHWKRGLVHVLDWSER